MDEMLAEDFDQYYLVSYEVEAQSILNAAQATDMPHLKKEDRADRFLKLKNLGYPNSIKSEQMTTQMFAKRLAGAIGKNGKQR